MTAPAVLALAGAVAVLPNAGVARLRAATPAGVRAPTAVPTWVAAAGAAGVAVVGAVMVGAGPAVAAAIVAVTLWSRAIRTRADRARSASLAALRSALDAVVADLGVGAHPALACESAANDADGTVGDAFGAAAARARLGGSAAPGFLEATGAIEHELRAVGRVWAVAERHGLPLADLLDAARSDLIGRSRFRSRTESALAGARATAAVLAGLPAVGIALGQAMGAAPLKVLLGGGIGDVLAVLGCTLVCAGLVWTDRITEKVTR
ncbi:type ii secretion system integral membrane subunit [Rhodococcus rhodnii]|uniref:Type II secretion system protein GspF domain-containing protein n=2 Tax=Rhodococcus rhodnii TaxID=38312 RepID=R7WI16_9NOCA|nr:type II secretion system F family protein [Rhodococcus rhodnii]EOM74801.1 hypothetical protein Rrhod_3882 [Rhodococcus rhodnii LMG 5362]TXG89308.1 type ii secretion system integral membrane subunit [Rhodococcus rhodnii]